MPVSVIDINTITIPKDYNLGTSRTQNRFLKIVQKQGLIEPLVIKEKKEGISTHGPDLLNAMKRAKATTVIVVEFKDLSKYEKLDI